MIRPARTWPVAASRIHLATAVLHVAACLVVALPAPAVAAEHPATAAAGGEALLMAFEASWCGPCRQMAPLVGEIASAGWPVRRIDVDHETDLVRRFGVTAVPCYVLTVRGREVGRIDGATTRAELERLMTRAAAPLGGTAPQAADSTRRQPSLPGIPVATAAATSPLATEPPPRAAAPAGIEPRLLAATARLLVEDDGGVCRGTGTIIDCRQGEALILTCGHIFRDSQGEGRIAVDLFAPGAPRGVAGQLIAWDLTRDLALVSVFTDVPVEAARVGGAERRASPGEPVLSVGCDGGADPTVHRSQVTAVDKYLGPSNVQVAGQPVQGRSGGGLFAADGTLIGVCNAADPTDNEGLFAALPTIHEQLEEAGLAFVYRNVYPSAGLEGAAMPGGSAHVPAMAESMPRVSFDRRDRADALPTASTLAPGQPDEPAPEPLVRPATPPGAPTAVPPLTASVQPHAAAAESTTASGEAALLEHVRQHGGHAEVICIVRPHGAPHDSSEVFVLKGARPDFVSRLAEAQRGASPPPATTR
jgi:thiol-disulfide isomerase/thioredoxin